MSDFDKTIAEQKKIMARQGEELDKVIHGVEKLKTKAVTIKEELTSQDKDLTNQEYQTGIVFHKLKSTTRQIENLQKPSFFASFLSTIFH